MDNKVQRVRIEPERTGWARMHDLVREYDKNKVVDKKEDIDTLLVFVSLYCVWFRIPNSSMIGGFVLSSRHRIHYRVLQGPPTTTRRPDQHPPHAAHQPNIPFVHQRKSHQLYHMGNIVSQNYWTCAHFNFARARLM